MKVSEASDAELNRFIANVFEPLGSISHQTRGISPLKVWIMEQRSTGRTFEFRWQPLDFCNTGDGLKMMMEWLAEDNNEPCLFHEIRDGNTGWFCYIEDIDWSRDELLFKPIGRSVAEAFALANGWKE